MVTLGADSHKATHTVVAVDETGAKLSHCHGEGELGRPSAGLELGRPNGANGDGHSRIAGTSRGASSATCWAPAKPWSGSRPGSQLESENPPAPQASRTPLMPSRRRALRCENRTCQQQPWTVPVGRCASWWLTGRTWWESAREFRIGFAGTSTSSPREAITRTTASMEGRHCRRSRTS